MSGYGVGLIILSSMALTYVLLHLLRPMLLRYALAHPTHRSSHSTATPQGAGIAVISAAVVTTMIGSAAFPTTDTSTTGSTLPLVLVAAGSLAIVGFADDVSGVRPAIRFLFQLALAALVVASLPADLRVILTLPVWVERGALVIGLVWLVNAWNFMDGLDWMTVAETLPIVVSIAILGLVEVVPRDALVVSAALAGAVTGFAPWNRPVARLFLGDAGSLAIGLLAGWLLVMLAATGFVAAALLLPLYYLADSTATLATRIVRRQRVWEAHRMHYYQRATDNGFTVIGVASRVFAVNVVLSMLAMLTVFMPSLWVQMACLGVGGLLVLSLLRTFSGVRR